MASIVPIFPPESKMPTQIFETTEQSKSANTSPYEHQKIKPIKNENFPSDPPLQITAMLKTINLIKKLYEESSTQQWIKGAQSQIPVAIAKTLIDDNGQLQENLIPEVLKIFNTPQINYVLTKLNRSSQLKEKLSNIRKPHSPYAPANVVIRTTLGLPPTNEVTDKDSVTVALAALMSNLRQGDSGSCFATPLAIHFLTSNLFQCLNDFKALIEESKLTRNVTNRRQDFPFLLRLNNQSLDRELLPSEALKDPGVIAASIELGIENLEACLQRDSPKKQSITKTLEHLTLKASELPCNKGVGKGYLFLRAVFAFNSRDTQGLLRVWENAIASMAEADEVSMIRSVLINVTVETVSKTLKLSEEQSIHFKSELIKNTHLQYDPVVSTKHSASDQHSTEGAFVLYKKINDSPPAKWKRIDTASKLQHLICELLKDQNQDKLSLIKSDQFLKEYLKSYHPSHRECKDVTNNSKQLKYTPWMTKSGNNFQKVVQIYTHDDKLSPQTTLKSPLPYNLLETILKMGQALNTKEMDTYAIHPGKTVPLRIPDLHAFSLILGHPSLVNAWKNPYPKDINSWIMTHVLKPGQHVANSHISDHVRTNISKTVCQEMIPESKRGQFYVRESIIPESQTYRSYRHEIAALVLQADESHTLSPKDVFLNIDSLILNNLPSSLAKQLKSTAIHFADTNWSNDGIDIHFTLMVNPGNGQLELMAIDAQNENPIALDQETWLRGKTWEFYPDLT